MKRLLVMSTALAACIWPAGAQMQRRASITGGGNNEFGKCTVEVVVDGSAEVAIQGDSGTLRDLNGQQPQWRRFECTSPMPANPVNLRFAGVDGRGRQQLIGSPRSGSPAVVRIEDQQGGAEGYTFDLMWGNSRVGSNGYNGGYDNRPNPPAGGQFTANQAMGGCRDAVRQQAFQQYGSRQVEIRDMRVDDNPGRRDWIVGRADVGHFGRPDDRLRFSCSVNLANGNVRSVELNPVGMGRSGDADRSFDPSARAMTGCQSMVTAKVHDSGFPRVEFGNTRVENRPGAGDRINGSVRGIRGGGSQWYNFSCSVDMRDGDVRSAELYQR